MPDKIKKISIVIPCYYSEKTIENVVNELVNVLKCDLLSYQYEIVLVNDGSTDGTMSSIRCLLDQYDFVKGIDLSRNFGQHAALLAGYRRTTGDIVVSMDDDGQAPLESLKNLIRAIEDGADAAFGRYVEKKHTKFRNLGSHLEDFLLNKLMGKPRNVCFNSFWAGKRYLIDEMIKYQGAYPYLAGLILQTTRNLVNVEVQHRERTEGSSGYSFFKLLALTVSGITGFSVVPLRIATLVGVICSIIGFSFSIIVIIRKMLNPAVLLGYSSSMAITLFIGGIIMLMLGVLGEYVGRSYTCLNRSPQYVVRTIISNEKEDKENV